jgi:hypothetical protein
VLLAAFLTWIGTSGCAWILFTTGSVLVEVLPITPAQVSFILEAIDFVPIIVFVLMMSGIVSWIPLLILTPIVKALSNADQDKPLIGAGIGILVGSATSLIIFGNDFPGDEMILLGIAVGGIMGATNMAFLRWLRKQTAKNPKGAPQK